MIEKLIETIVKILEKVIIFSFKRYISQNKVKRSKNFKEKISTNAEFQNYIYIYIYIYMRIIK